LEFPAVIGQWYHIKFSSDLVNWYTSEVPVKAPATQVQWIDNGAPLTSSPPSTVKSRFYRVVEFTPGT
jgi:hypothetical protein